MEEVKTIRQRDVSIKKKRPGLSAIEANKAAQNQSWSAWVGSFWGGSEESEPQ